MEIVITSIALVLAGVGIGVLSGMLGIGGGTIMIPVLRLGYGLDAFMATATSLFAIIPISLAGAVTHIRARSCLPKLGILLGVAGAVTSSAGVYLGSVSPAWLIMVVAAVIIIYSAFTMLSKAVRMGKKSSSKSGSARASASGTPSNIEPCTFGFTRKNVALAVNIGLISRLCLGLRGCGRRLHHGAAHDGVARHSHEAHFGHVAHRHHHPRHSRRHPAGLPRTHRLPCGHHVVRRSHSRRGARRRLVSRVPERTLRFIFSGLLAVAAVVLVVNEFGLL